MNKNSFSIFAQYLFDMKILLIYNKFAGAKSAEKRESIVVAALKASGHELEIIYTKPNRATVKEIENMDLNPYDAFVIGGGDGTIMNALNGYIPNKSENKPPIGFIPVGTGNAYVRDLGLKTCDIEQAVALITKNEPKAVDGAWARAGDDEYYYFNILGIGFVADVGYTAQKFKQFGNFAYTIGIFIEALRLKSQKAKMIIDGETYEFDHNFIEISNTRYTSNFLMSPDAEFDDGLLDVTVLEAVNVFRLLSSFPKILDGTHIKMPEVKTFKAKHIIVESEKTKVATPDGELRGTTPLEVKVLKHIIKVFA